MKRSGPGSEDGPPFEVAKISSHNHYAFRNQRPDNALEPIEPLFLEKMKCTNPNPLLRPKWGYDVMTPLNQTRYWFSAKIIFFSRISVQKRSYNALDHFLWRNRSALTLIHCLSLNKVIMTSLPPLELAKILIFSQNDYLWNQGPEKVLKRLEPLSSEKLKCKLGSNAFE